MCARSSRAVASPSVANIDTVSTGELMKLAMGVSRGLLRVTGSTEAFDGVDDERSQGMVAALLFAGLDLGKLIGPLAAGFTAEAFGLAAMFRILPVTLLALYLPLELMARRGLAGRAEAARSGPLDANPVASSGEDPPD